MITIVPYRPAWPQEFEAIAADLLYSLATGSVASKPGAGEWAQQELGALWASLIERALAQRHKAGSITRQEEAETLAFLQFTLGQATGN
jgi:hypothetical protein